MKKPALFAAILYAFAAAAAAASETVTVPEFPAPASTPRSGLQSAVFAGGCFWGVEAVFEHVKGVTDVVSGYSGGRGANPSYEAVSSDSTGHAEAVRVTYDPKQVSYGQLLKVFFSVAHDPTQLNRQGPDRGTQYRSAIFYADEAQKRGAEAYIAELRSNRSFDAPIVTQLARLRGFYRAEYYHQDFARKNPVHPYILAHDAPKVALLKQSFPAMYRPEWTVQLAAARR